MKNFSLFNQSTHQQLKSSLAKIHGENVDELKEELSEEYFLLFSTEEFKESLEEILEQSFIKSLTPLTFQFLHLVENFLFLAYLHNEHEEFEILDFWQDTIFNQSFMDLYETDKDSLR